MRRLLPFQRNLALRMVAAFLLGLIVAFGIYNRPTQATPPTNQNCECELVRRYSDNVAVCAFDAESGCPNPCLADPNNTCTQWICDRIGSQYYTVPYACSPAATPTPRPTKTPTPTPLPPTLTLEFLCDVWGNAGWCRSGGRIKATGTDPNNQSILVSGDTGGPSPQRLVCSGTDTCTATASVVEGTGTAQARATGPGGTVSQSLDWKYDPTAPTLVVNAPGVLSCLSSLTGRVEDATSGIAQVAWSRDGGATWETVASTAGDFSVTWDVRSLPEGTHFVHFRAWDVAGNTTEVTREVLVRHPNIGIGIQPQKGFFWDTFRIGVEPGCMKITRMRVVVENPDGPDAVLGEWDTRSWDRYGVAVKWDGLFPVGAAPPGTYWLRVDVWDQSGRVLRDFAEVVMPVFGPQNTPTPTPSSTPTFTATPTGTPTRPFPSSTPEPKATATPVMVAPSRPSPTPQPTPTPTPTLPGASAPPPEAGVSLLPAALIALAMVVWSLRDPRVVEVARLRRLTAEARRLSEWDRDLHNE